MRADPTGAHGERGELRRRTSRSVARSDQLDGLCVSPTASVRHAIEQIGRNNLGIVLVTDSDRRLLATITDGDVRRSILSGVRLSDPVTEIVARGSTPESEGPVTIGPGAAPDAMLRLMRAHELRHLPVIEGDRVVGLVVLEDLVPDPSPPVRALIMAGGHGRRLRPLTETLPKPMLPVGDRPIMERMVVRLQEAGIRSVCVSTHYLPQPIVEHFRDGSEFGVELSYVREDEPLGTAGALRLLETTDEPLLVINGDILTDVDFRAMVRYHRAHGAELTMAVRRYAMKVPYGVVEIDGAAVRSLVEKPTLDVFMNAGIYLLEPSARERIPESLRYDMTDLVGELLRCRRPVASFPVLEYWIDIGQPVDYERARADARRGRIAP